MKSDQGRRYRRTNVRLIIGVGFGKDRSVDEQRKRYAVGSLAAGIEAELIDLGVHHPSHAGLLVLDVDTVGGVVTRLRVKSGLMHRGAEMLFEVRDYRQVLSLANRHDWQAPYFGEWLVARAVEESLGIEPPPRARALRVLLAEHFRIASHLAYLTIPAFTRSGERGVIVELREAFLEQNFALTGNRVHPMVIRLGGLAEDATPAWLAAEQVLLSRLLGLAERLDRELAGPTGEALVSLAEVTAHHVGAFGLTGPTARAAGVELDLRRHDREYSAVASLLDPRAAPGAAGDARARFGVLISQLRESVRLIGAVADDLTDGPVSQHLPKVIKVPEGDYWQQVEAPLGHAGVLLVSRGEKTPWRLALRTPSFNQVSSWEQVLLGCPADRLAEAIASLPYVIGDLDK